MTASYAYDPGGRRVKKTVNALTTFYLSAGAEEIAEYDSTGTLLRRYVPGPGTDRPIAMVVPVAGGTATASRAYFQVDRLGSTIAMTGDAGTLTEGPFTYDAYGNSSAPATGVPFRYTGRRLDPETGLYYYRARYYSPALGRFLQTDPIGYEDNFNLYAYAGNDPVNGTDPSGRCGPATPICAAVAACASDPACVALIVVTIAVAGQIFSNNAEEDDDKKQVPPAEGEEESSEKDRKPNHTPGGRPIREHGAKGGGDDYVKGKGWDVESGDIDDAIDNHPGGTEEAKDGQIDTRTGKPRNEPATWYYDKDGYGVLVNDGTGEIIGIDDRLRAPR